MAVGIRASTFAALTFAGSLLLAAQGSRDIEQWRADVRRTRLLAENNATQALEQSRRLLAELPAGAEPEDRIRVLNVLARAEIYAAHTADAGAHAREAVELAKRFNSRRGELEAQLNLCIITVHEARIDALVDATMRAIALLDPADPPDLRGEALLRASMMYRRIGQLEKSVNTSMRALEIAQHIDDPLVRAYAHYGVGTSYLLSDQYELGRSHFNEMVESARAANSKQLEGHALLGLANCQRNAGNHDAAEASIRQAIAMFREIASPFSLGPALFALAQNLRDLGRFREAQPLIQETVEIYERHANKIGLWYALGARSATHLALGDGEAARADSERTYELAREINFPLYLSESARTMAKIAAEDGDYRKAYAFSEESADMNAKAARDKTSARTVELVERFEAESEARAIAELRRHGEQQAAALRQHQLQQRWLWTVLGGSIVALGGTAFFLVRLHRSHRLLQATHAQLQQSETRLQKQTGVLQSILDGMGEGVVVADRDGTLVIANPAAERLAGFRITGQGYTVATAPIEVFRADRKTPFPPDELPLSKARHGEPSDGVEVFVRAPAFPEGRWLTVSARPLRDGSGTCGGIAVFSDITARKEIDEQIRALNASLEQRVRDRTAELEVANRELEAFSYSVSHDLRAPLRTMDGFSRILLEDYRDKLAPQGVQDLRSIRAASQRMGQLIDDMLRLARVTRAELNRQPVDLSAMAIAILEGLKRASPERTVHVDIARGLTARADANLMRIALENLLGNAWKFTSKQADARIEFARAITGGHTAFVVRDNGVGFEPEFSHKLFIAFQRLHTPAEFPGTGIGLATVQRIVHRHGGRVWAEGTPGKGAAFYFTLPD